MKPISPHWVALAGCLAFTACQQTGGHIQFATTSTAETPAASIVGSSDDTQWQYLAAKYDTNGDARITSAEYDRSEKTFAGFDRDGNGALEPSDFERGESGGGMSMSPADMRRMVSPMILAKYFQSDDDEATLVRTELKRAFRTFDADGNGAVTRNEFEAEAKKRGASPMGGMDRFSMLAVSAAGDGAESFDLAQLASYFDSVAEGGQLEAPQMMGMGGGGGRGRDAAAKPKAGNAPNAVGKMAPDFALPKLHGVEGDALVRLSSFRGKKPVALIFGSYT